MKKFYFFHKQVFRKILKNLLILKSKRKLINFLDKNKSMYYRPNDKILSKLSCISRKNKNIKDRILYGPNGLSPIASGS